MTQETLPQPAFAHSLEAPCEWKESDPRGQTSPAIHKTRHRADAANRVGISSTVRSRQGNATRAQRRKRSGVRTAGSFMTKAYTFPTIDQYLRERLMPVKGTIPNIVGIDMYGNSIPARTVGGADEPR